MRIFITEPRLRHCMAKDIAIIAYYQDTKQRDDFHDRLLNTEPAIKIGAATRKRHLLNRT